MKTRIRVISLTTAAERRHGFSEKALLMDAHWEFFDAHTQPSSELIYEEQELLVRHARPLTNAELGCYSSHFTVWTDFLSSNDDQLVVLEDDVSVDWIFLKGILGRNFSKDGIDYLRLYSLAFPPFVNRGEYLGRYLYHLLGYALGTQAYLLTRDGAANLVKYCRRVKGPIDIVIDQAWRGSEACFAVFPYPVFEISVPSTIGGSRNGRLIPSSPWTKIIKIKRLIFRVENAIRLRFYRVRAYIGLGPRAYADRRWS